MASKRKILLNKIFGGDKFGIRLNLIDRASDRVIDFGTAEKLIPFFKFAGVTFIDLGDLNAFDRNTKNDLSIFAKDPLLISDSVLASIGFSEKNLPADAKRDELVIFAAEHCISKKNRNILSGIVEFDCRNEYWLKSYATFSALSKYIGTNRIHEWPPEIRDRERKPIEIVNNQLSDKILLEKVLQFLVARSYSEFVEHIHEAKISISADMNLTCEECSSETWGNGRLFFFNKEAKATVYYGLPPSQAIETGIKSTKVPYRWNGLYNDEYEFFHQLFEYHEREFDYVHVLNGYSLFHYWEIPNFEKNTEYGRWVPIKSNLFFEYNKRHFDAFPYFFDFNEPLFPKHELSVCRYSLLQSAIDGEPLHHTCGEYDLSREIQLISSKLCNTKLIFSNEQKKSILDSAKSNIKNLMKSEIPVKIIHIDEVCALLEASISNLVKYPQKYGEMLGRILFEEKIVSKREYNSKTCKTSQSKQDLWLALKQKLSSFFNGKN